MLSGHYVHPTSTSRLAQALRCFLLTKRYVDHVHSPIPMLTPFQAAESLCMNGRALNDKAIEVSPSSSRVLDRAAEILMPFPPSKNRPRPGDWTCPSCGFSNFQRRTACFRCSYPAMGAPPAADPSMGYGYGYGHGMMGGPPHMGHGHMGHVRGPPASAVPFRAGDWKCGADGCGYHNFAKNVSCLRCGASRAGAALVADSGYAQGMSSNSYDMHGPSMGGAPGPGPGPYGAGPGGYGSGGGFHGQQYGGPPSTFSMPSNMGAGPNAYPPMGSHFAHSGHSHSNFDSRGTESGFPSGGPTPSSGGGPGSMSNGSNYGFDGASDPFSFLSTGLGSLSMKDNEPRRNGSQNPTKSPS